MTTTFHNNPGKRKSLPDGGVKPIGRPFWLLSPGVIWLLLFGLAPLAFMLMMSFWTSTIFGTKPDFSFDNYARVIVTDLYRDQLFKTLRIAFMTTVLTVFISYPVAYLLSRLKGMQKALFVLMVFLPFWTSYVIRAFVWLPILGRNGAINNMLQALGLIDAPIDWLLYNEGSVFLGLVYVYTLFMTLPIYLSLEKIDPALIEAATDLGAKPGSILVSFDAYSQIANEVDCIEVDKVHVKGISEELRAFQVVLDAEQKTNTLNIETENLHLFSNFNSCLDFIEN